MCGEPSLIESRFLKGSLSHSVQSAITEVWIIWGEEGKAPWKPSHDVGSAGTGKRHSRQSEGPHG